MKKHPIPKTPIPLQAYNRQNRQKVKYSRRFSDHVIHGVMIFASVLLAFWLNDFRLNQEEKKRTKAAIEAVINEINQNMVILQTWTPRHGELYQRLDEFRQNSLDTATVFNLEQFLDGPIMQQIITYDSWDIIRQTNPQMDFDTRLLINHIYRQQEYVDNALKALIDFFYQRESYSQEIVQENYLLFTMLVGNLWGQGEAMIREYGFALEQLER